MNLLASNAWSLDVVFFAVLLLGILLGCFFGFVRGICKIAGWVASTVLAVSFCVPFKNNLESWFGLQTALANSTGSALVGSWVSVAIAFIALMILVRIVAYLFGKLGTALVDKSKITRAINRFLGGLLGLLEAAALIFLLLAACYWINVGSINNFIGSSAIVGKIYHWEWFIYAARFSFI